MKKQLLRAVLAGAVLAAPVAADAHVGGMSAPAGVGAGESKSGPIEHVTQLGGSTGGHVVLQGDRLYMGMYGIGTRMFDVSTPETPREVGRWKPADASLAQPAVADAPPDAAVFDGRHIAVLNGTNRTSRSLPISNARTDNTYFLDTTDPAKPKLLWSFIGGENGESHNGDIVDERRLWIPSGGAGELGLRIYDLRPLLQSPAAEPARLFKGDPAKLWDASPHRNGRPVGPAFTHTHDVTVYPGLEVDGAKRDVMLLAEGGGYTNDAGNTGSMFVIDITEPSQPVVLQRWLHERGAGHHPIRYHHEAQFLHGDPRVVLVTDEDLHNGCDAGGVTALRLSEDLTSSKELSEWFIADGLPATTTTPWGVCSVHVFSSHGNLVFFGSYSAGLQVVDYSDPEKPKRLGHNVQLGADSWGAEYKRGGLIYVGDFGSRGLDVFRLTEAPDLAVLTPSRRGTRLVTQVKNNGSVTMPASTLEFRSGPSVLASREIPALAPGKVHDVVVSWTSKRRLTVTVVADAGNRFDEASETNNSSTAAIAPKKRKRARR